MATTLSPERRQGQVTTSYRQGKLSINETWHYQIKTDSPTTTRTQILETSGLPLPGIFVSSLGLCRSTVCERNEDNVLIWNVTCTFSSDVDSDSTNQNPLTTDPNSWVPIYETFLEPYEEYPIKDINDKPYENGAGFPFQSSTPTPKDNIRWEFFQFEDPATVTDEVVAERNNTINSATFKGREKHTLKLKIRRSIVGYYYGQLRRLTEYSLTWKESNWHDKIANIGQTFVSGGDVHDYRYSSNPDTVVYGPLGSKDYKFDENLDAAAGLPTGGVETVGGQTYAVKTSGELYFIERQSLEEKNFSTFLRL